MEFDRTRERGPVRVLVAEDDLALRSVLARGLKENGYVVDAVADGEDAVRHLRAYDYDVAVLDWRMPGRTGLEVVTEARRVGDRTPMLMLTARDTASDRVTGLNGGADDYLVKPFDFSELLARLHALQRRPPLVHDPVLKCGDLRFDPSTRQVTVSGASVTLTAIETSLVELLLRRSPAIVTRSTIGTQVWEDEADAVGSNTIDVHVGRVRAKLAASRARIETVRGTGYRMVGT
jgi:DNA-binding response OmpR family regulator